MTHAPAPTPRGHDAEPATELIADIVFRDGAVLVMDERGSRAEALAVADGRIIVVGSNEEVDACTGNQTQVIDLHGRALLPGINDSHLHGSWLGARWPHTIFGSAADDAGAGDGSGAGAGAGDGPGDALDDGPPAGALVSTRAEREDALLRAGELLSELGITSYTEPGIGPGEDDGETGCFHSEVLDVYRELAATGRLRQRVTLLSLYGVLDGPSALEPVLDGIREQGAHLRTAAASDPHWLAVPGVKIFGDLIPLTRGAWVTSPYDDGSHGDLLVEGDDIDAKATALAAMLAEAHRAGLQVGLHATGDRTIQLALDAFAAAEREPGAPSAAELGHVIIHGDLATATQVATMKRLGMWLNAQAGIAALTREWLAGMLGAEAEAAAWPFEAALDAGVLVLSSDSPVLGFDWRRGIADAEARIVGSRGPAAPADTPEEAEERLHRLLRAYTAVPAMQDRADAWKGTLEVGKVGDMVVLAEDPFAVGAAGLPDVDVEMTVVDGRIVFERAAVAG